MQLGDFQIDRAHEWIGPWAAPDKFFPDFDPAVLAANRDWLAPYFDAASGDMLLSMHSFIVRTGRYTILIDACMGNHKERPLRPPAHQRSDDTYLGNLTRLGVKPEEVDFVMCTHMHWDHIGWNTRQVDGQWQPTFPNARYIMARREYEHWDALYASGDRSQNSLGFGDSVLPIIRAERAVLVDDGYQLQDGIWLEPCPGHTPGNVVINVRSKDQRGVFSGDVLHSPLQLVRTDWSSHACSDMALSRISRTRFIEHHADTATLVMPAHFAAPSVGHIVSQRGAYAFKTI
jgi:glyoxylase-like metal-dependent hydrolase (beta-lactamase superfamily II)